MRTRGSVLGSHGSSANADGLVFSDRLSYFMTLRMNPSGAGPSWALRLSVSGCCGFDMLPRCNRFSDLETFYSVSDQNLQSRMM